LENIWENDEVGKKANGHKNQDGRHKRKSGAANFASEVKPPITRLAIRAEISGEGVRAVSRGSSWAGVDVLADKKAFWMFGRRPKVFGGQGRIF